MRRINKNYLAPPPSLAGATANTRLLNIAKNRAYNGTHYKNPDVIDALSKLYYNKCGYCESYIAAVAHQHVEHYRPKSRVSSRDLGGLKHDGYYWLGNEWSNLLISCPWCNENGRKGDRFPLTDPTVRVANHPALLSPTQYDIAANHIHHPHLRPEMPLIINPETCNPRKHLIAKRDGKLSAKHASAAGSKTIEICALNRDGLIVKRKAIIDGVVNEINKALRARTRPNYPLNDNQFQLQLFDLFDGITANTYAKQEYTMVYRDILKYFDDLILAHKKIEPRFRAMVARCFNAY